MLLTPDVTGALLACTGYYVRTGSEGALRLALAVLELDLFVRHRIVRTGN